MGLFGLGLDLFSIIKEEEPEESIISILKEYSIIGSTINNFEELMELIKIEAIKEATKFLKREAVHELFSSIDDISDIYNSVMKEGLINANKQITDQLFEQEDYQNRLEVFESMYEMGLLEGGYFKSYVECINCLPGIYSGYLSCNITPSKLKFKCPNCAKEVYYMVPYKITRDLFEHIIDKDGVLSFSIEFLLNEYKIEYKKNLNLEDKNEIDFVLFENDRPNCLIEVKMFKKDRPIDTKKANLKNSISQIKKSLEKLRNVNPTYQSTQTVLVTNYLDKNLYNDIKNECSEDIDKYNLLILSPEEFKESL